MAPSQAQLGGLHLESRAGGAGHWCEVKALSRGFEAECRDRNLGRPAGDCIVRRQLQRVHHWSRVAGLPTKATLGATAQPGHCWSRVASLPAASIVRGLLQPACRRSSVAWLPATSIVRGVLQTARRRSIVA